MSQRLNQLADRLRQDEHLDLLRCEIAYGELNVEVAADNLKSSCYRLRDEYAFEELMDLAGVDYSAYGVGEWATDDASDQGFSRGVEPKAAARFSFEEPAPLNKAQGKRFAVAYQLLSISQNVRLRLKAFCEDDDFPRMASVVDVWNCVNWYEREAFDLFGILFDGHPDLRRILTDYGFVGHPLRKDFPLIGHVEMRYDPEQARVIYEPVSIEPRVNVPKVIRRGDHSQEAVEVPEQGDA
jgi:NADH-quinone oxidoreductase subunit C